MGELCGHWMKTSVKEYAIRNAQRMIQAVQTYQQGNAGIKDGENLR